MNKSKIYFVLLCVIGFLLLWNILDNFFGGIGYPWLELKDWAKKLLEFDGTITRELKKATAIIFLMVAAFCTNCPDHLTG